MARKGQISVQDTVETNEEFENYLNEHDHQLILMEVYSEFCGQCQAMLGAVKKIKLDLGGDDIAMVKAVADKIDDLERFRGKSEPVYLFISKGKICDVLFGANGVKLFEMAEEQLRLEKGENEGKPPRMKQAFNERTALEEERIEIEAKKEAALRELEERQTQMIQAARKRRVNERLSSNSSIKRLNFILFWPHCHQAHYDLYEKWDRINLQVAAKEVFMLTEEQAKEVIYMSDIDANEACLHALLSGEVMAVMFKMFDTDDRDIIKLMRYSLYEEIPDLKEDKPPEEQPPQVTAFMRYASVSKAKPEVRRLRYEEKQQKKREEQEERERLAREQERIAREEEEERVRLQKAKEDEERIARLQAGVKEEVPEPVEGEQVEGEQTEGEKTEGEQLEGDQIEDEVAGEAAPEEVVSKEIIEEKIEEIEEFSSQISVEGEEYIPPGGLFVPGLYSPPNELAKANGLAVFFPKMISQVAPIESEFLPPHVLMTFPVEKRKEVMETAAQFPDDIIHQGIFAGDNIYEAEHVAFTVKQYEKMFRIPQPKERLALMVSRKRSVAMLTLTTLGPNHISMDLASGQKECQALFPVGYGDDHEDEITIVEEEPEQEIQEAPAVIVPEKETQEAQDEENAEAVEEIEE